MVPICSMPGRPILRLPHLQGWTFQPYTITYVHVLIQVSNSYISYPYHAWAPWHSCTYLWRTLNHHMLSAFKSIDATSASIRVFWLLYSPLAHFCNWRFRVVCQWQLKLIVCRWDEELLCLFMIVDTMVLRSMRVCESRMSRNHVSSTVNDKQMHSPTRHWAVQLIWVRRDWTIDSQLTHSLHSPCTCNKSDAWFQRVSIWWFQRASICYFTSLLTRHVNHDMSKSVVSAKGQADHTRQHSSARKWTSAAHPTPPIFCHYLSLIMICMMLF